MNPEPIAVRVSPASRPVADADLEEISALMQESIATFSAQDFEAHFKLYHFPTVRFSGGQVFYFPALADLPRSVLATELPPDYAASQWASLEIVQSGPGKVHLATVFQRVRKDGSEIGRHSSLYILEKVGGRWGIRARSSFAD
jgi:hypothetical protein